MAAPPAPPAPPAPLAAADLGDILALLRAGRHADLEAKARGWVEEQPTRGVAWKALGVALTLQGKNSLHATLRAAELLPDDAEAHCNLGNALQSLGRPDEAVASYRRALHLTPRYPEACNNLGNALRGLGRLDEAIAGYRRAVEIAPDFAEAHSNLGNALRALGRLDAAVTSYRQALAIRPQYPEACNNLGNALFDLGQFDAAAASYAQAFAIKSDFAEACSNLGNALRRLGRLQEAAARYAEALALEPDFAGAHSNLGDVLRDLGRPAAAEASCRRAIEIQPRLAGAHNSVGNALLDLGRVDEAVASYGRATALRPDFMEAHINLGLALRQQGLIAAAEDACRTALKLNPEAAAAIVLRAELRADGGCFAEAEELFTRAAALEPDLPEAWAGIAHLRKMTNGDAAWAAQVHRLAGQSLAPRREVYLRFALGKYFDDVRDFERAFGNYRRAHELLQQAGARYDRRQAAQGVDRSIEFYDREHMRRPPDGADHSSRPVFIVGMPRSGTTLAEQILASHPAVFGAGELPFWQNTWLPEASARNAAAGDGPRRPVPGDGISGDDGRRSGASAGDGTPGDARTAANLAAVYLQLLNRISPDAARVVDKMPANFLQLGLIRRALPNARIIHMRRNPIDTCLSIYFQHFKSGHSYANDLHDLACYYKDYLRLMAHWRSVLPEDSILDVPYEGLVDDQEGWSRRMLQFIGLPWDARCLDFHRTARSVTTASKWQVRQKISRSSIERWRNYEPFIGPLLELVQVRAIGRSHE